MPKWDSWTDAISVAASLVVWVMIVLTLRQLKASLADRQKVARCLCCFRRCLGTDLVLLPLFDGFLKLVGLECVFTLCTHVFDLTYDLADIGDPQSPAHRAFMITWSACSVVSHAVRSLCQLTLLVFLSRDSAGKTALRGSIAVAVVWALADATIVAWTIYNQQTPDLSAYPDLHDWVEGIVICTACLAVAAEHCFALWCRPRGRRSSRGPHRRRNAWKLVWVTLFVFSAGDLGLCAMPRESDATYLRWLWRMLLYLLQLPVFYLALRHDSLYWLRMGRSSGAMSWDEPVPWWESHNIDDENSPRRWGPIGGR